MLPTYVLTEIFNLDTWREWGSGRGRKERKQMYLLCIASVRNVLATNICVAFSLTEHKKLHLFLYCAKHHFSNEIDTEYKNMTSDENSDMDLAQPLYSMYWMSWLR
jgi:hypothetical protein